MIGALSCSTLSFAADYDGTSQGGIVNLTGGSYDNVYGIQRVVDENGDYTQNISSDSASVTISSGAQIAGSVYGGFAVIDFDSRVDKLGDAQAIGNEVRIMDSSIRGSEIVGGYALSKANYAHSGSVLAEKNRVTVVSSNLTALVVGGYTENGSGSTNSISRSNTIDVKNSHTRSLYGGYVGSTQSNKPEVSTAIQNNVVSVSENSVVGSERSHRTVMGGWINQSSISENTLIAEANRVSIQNSTTYANIYGSHVRGALDSHASGSTASRSTNNTVSILQSTVFLKSDNGITGAYAFHDDKLDHKPNVSVELNNNSVSVSGADIVGDASTSHIYGGFAELRFRGRSSNAIVESNRLEVRSSTVTVGEMVGGKAEILPDDPNDLDVSGVLGEAFSNANEVKLVNSTIDTTRIIGGLAKSYGSFVSEDTNETVVTANNNTVEIDGGKVTGEIYGGYVFSEKVDDAGEGITNPTAKFESNGNTVILKGNADLTGAGLFGSNRQNADTTGNTLIVDGWSGTVKAVENFNKIQLKNINWVDNGTVLEISTSDGSLSGTEIDVVSLASGDGIAAGQKMFLVHGSGNLGTSADQASVNQDFLSGVGVQGEGLLTVDANGNVIYEIQSLAPSSQVEVLLTNHSLASVFLNSGFDMVAYGINKLEKENLLGRHVFAVAQGSALEYDTGRGMKVNGWNAIYGFGGMSGDFGAAAFFEHGSGDYRLWNNTPAGIRRGSGDLQYQGGGFALKAKLGERMAVGTALRAGRLTNSADNLWADTNGRSFGYEMEMPYVAFTAGVKGVLYKDSNITARARAAYETTWIGGEDFRVEGTQFEVAHINSHQARVGAGVDYRFSDANTFSIYLDYAYEFNAESRGSVQGMAIKSESLKGGTAGAEFMWNCAPDQNWDIDARLKLQTGAVEGVTGLVHVGYRF